MARGTKLARSAPRVVRVRTGGGSAKVAKLQDALKSARKSASRRVEKQQKSGLVVAGVVGALYGALNRKGIEIPMVGEAGTAAVGAAAALALGAWKGNKMATQAGIALTAIAAQEFVEESPTLSFMD